MFAHWHLDKRIDGMGVTFTVRGRVLREVNRDEAKAYDHLMESGLYQRLTTGAMMVKHIERGLKFARTDDAYRVIQAQPVPLTTYPYEWSFSQFKRAALLVLDVARAALDYDMLLHHTDINHVQLLQGQPVWTDVLAFSLYREGQPWTPYLDYVRQYLAPLALMARVDITLGRLLQIYPDGVSVPLASAMLPGRTRVNFGLTTHIHSNTKPRTPQRMDRQTHATLLDNLYETVDTLDWQPDAAAWESHAAAEQPLDGGAFDVRHRFLRDAINTTRARHVWDMHAGTGTYSRIAADEFGASVIAFNRSPHVTERLHASLRDDEKILPLLQDWNAPSPGLGWAHHGRRSIRSRAGADLLLAIGLTHRLAVSDGVTFAAMAAWFVRLAPALVVEFIPATDPQVIALLESGQPALPDYTREAFEAAFERHYEIMMSEDVNKDGRALYLMQGRTGS